LPILANTLFIALEKNSELDDLDPIPILIVIRERAVVRNLAVIGGRTGIGDRFLIAVERSRLIGGRFAISRRFADAIREQFDRIPALQVFGDETFPDGPRWGPWWIFFKAVTGPVTLRRSHTVTPHAG
jgi:hypothetical protein